MDNILVVVAAVAGAGCLGAPGTMTDDELEELRRAAVSRRNDLIIQLGAYVGLRACEIPQIQPQHIKQEGDQYRLRVPEGKDTANGEGKPRDAFLPSSVERDLQQFQTAENIAPRDSFIELTERGVRAVVKRTAEAAADQTGDEDSFQAIEPYLNAPTPDVVSDAFEEAGLV